LKYEIENSIDEIQKIIRKSPEDALSKVDLLLKRTTNVTNEKDKHRIEILYYKCLISIGNYNSLATAIDKYLVYLDGSKNIDIFLETILYKINTLFHLGEVDKFNATLNQYESLFSDVENMALQKKFLAIKSRAAYLNEDHLQVIKITNELLQLEIQTENNLVHQTSYLHDIAISYMEMKNFDDAMHYLKKANSILKDTTEHYSIILNLLNTAQCLRFMNDLKLSFKTILKAEAYSETYNFTLFNAFIYSELAHINFEMKEYQVALEYCNLSFKFFRTDNVKDDIYAGTKILSYQCQAFLGNYNDISKEGEQILELVLSFNNTELPIKMYTLMYEYYLHINENEKANYYLKKISAG